MSTFLNHVTEQKKSIISKQVDLFLSWLFSNKLKRLFFISSVLGLIKEIKEPDDYIVAKLNEMFIKAKYPDALILPMYIKNLIWKDVITSDVSIIGCGNRDIGLDEKVDIINRLVANAPVWMRYSSISDMRNDALNLFRSMNFITGSDDNLLQC